MVISAAAPGARGGGPVWRRLGRHAARILVSALLGGIATATLVRMSPGYGTDEQDLSFALSDQSRDALRAVRGANSSIASFYVTFVAGLAKGDLGFSRTLNRPVAELLRERLPETLVSVLCGVAGGIAAGVALALATIFWRLRWADLAAGTLSGLFLSVPAAVLALIFLWSGRSGRVAIALLVSPHVYVYVKSLLAHSASAAHVMSARTRGLTRSRILLMHIVAPVAPQLFAVAGISATLAFGAAIPVEVVCDMPGLGQLAWKAALGRDLPLLVTITMLVTLMTMLVNAAADLLGAAFSGSSRDTAC